jgi:hypothetical protein
MTLKLYAAHFAALVCCACALAAAPTTMPMHSHAEAGVSSMDVYADGDVVHLLLARRDDNQPPMMQYVRSTDAGEIWSEPVIVGKDQPAPEPAHRGADVQVAASGQNLVACWTIGSDTDRFGRGALATAYSKDGGKTWSAGPNPADDGSAAGHAFIDLAADSDGSFHVVWIDGRDGSAGKGLRYARSTDGGASWSANVTLDPETCECCWNTIKCSRSGQVFVLYRDADPRDMAIVSSPDSGKSWTTPVTVGAFGWKVNGCPHVGGGLAIDDVSSGVYASVWTAKDQKTTGAYFLASHDGGKIWSEPMKLGDSTSWHSDLACDQKRIVAVWDAMVDSAMAVFSNTSDDGGKSWTAMRRLSERDVSATHPRIVHTSRGFLVIWTQRHGTEPLEFKSLILR